MPESQGTPVAKNQIFTALVEDLTDEGLGVCRVGGFAVFVPFVIPGEEVEGKIVSVKKSFAHGILLRVLAPSADRIDPGCGSFRRCGGCALRHMSYAAELRQKEATVRAHITRIGRAAPEFLSIVPSPAADRYRNKGIFPVAADESGRLFCGLYARRSHRVVEAQDCALHPEIFGQVTGAILTFLTARRVTAYDEATGRGLLRHLYLRRSGTTGELLVCLIVNGGELPGVRDLAQLLRGRFPEVSALLLCHNTRRDNVLLTDRFTALFGDGAIRDCLCGLQLRVSAQSFFQINGPAAELLYARAIELAALRGDETVVDLYCGTGAIGLCFAPHVREVIGIEIVPAAVADAEANARENGIRNARFIAADAARGAEALIGEGVCPDVLIVDPPRAGCSAEMIDAAVKLRPQKILYISCNSATLARDIERLRGLAYRAAVAEPHDLFPRTPHTEVVVLLQKI